MTKILVRIELSQIGNVLKTAEDKFFLQFLTLKRVIVKGPTFEKMSNSAFSRRVAWVKLYFRTQVTKTLNKFT